MTISVSPTESDALAALRSYLLTILPDGIDVIRGQDNRVPSPKAPNYLVMTPTRRGRISTNVDSFVDCRFIASIAGDTMTVSAVSYGSIKVGSVVFGVDVANPTTVTALGTVNPDGTGTYTVSPAQTVASEVMAAGVLDVLQPVDLTVQIDVHGPASADYVHRVSTMLRDEHAVRAFAALNANIVPLHAEDPKQIPFINDQQQYEYRWIVEACLQVNESVLDIPQQFFEKAVVGLIEIDSHYPPT